MRLLCLASVVVLCVAPDLPRADEVKDREPMQGTWKIVTIKSKGKESELNLVLDVTADGMCLRQPDQKSPEQFRFVVDASVTPNLIDIYKSDAKGKRAEKLFEGLIELKDADMRLCFTSTPGPPWNRPTSLTPADDSADILITFRKE
jgi:uncharacterized protein (TIGR03067 family)